MIHRIQYRSLMSISDILSAYLYNHCKEQTLLSATDTPAGYNSRVNCIVVVT